MDTASLRRKIGNLMGKVDDPPGFTLCLRGLLEQVADRGYLTGYNQRFIPGLGQSFGVRMPILDLVSTELRKFGQKDPGRALPLLGELWRDGCFEERIIVGKALEGVARADWRGALDLISFMVREISNWAVCDNLAMFGMRPLVTGYFQEVLALSRKWVRDPNKWVRRFGVVTFYPLTHGPKRPLPMEVFPVIGLLMRDEDLDVKRAVAWILREMSKREPQLVFGFLCDWVQANNRHTRWMVRQGMKRLPQTMQAELKALL